MISPESKVKMSLDELSEIYKLQEENNKLVEQNKLLKKKNNEIIKRKKELEKDFKLLKNDYYSLKDNLEILELEDWIIHNTYNNNEYVSGYLISEKKMWDTSNILSKTATKYGLIIITMSEHIYYLPYSESYVNY